MTKCRGLVSPSHSISLPCLVPEWTPTIKGRKCLRVQRGMIHLFISSSLDCFMQTPWTQPKHETQTGWSRGPNGAGVIYTPFPICRDSTSLVWAGSGIAERDQTPNGEGGHTSRWQSIHTGSKSKSRVHMWRVREMLLLCGKKRRKTKHDEKRHRRCSVKLLLAKEKGERRANNELCGSANRPILRKGIGAPGLEKIKIVFRGWDSDSNNEATMVYYEQFFSNHTKVSLSLGGARRKLFKKIDPSIFIEISAMLLER